MKVVAVEYSNMFSYNIMLVEVVYYCLQYLICYVKLLYTVTTVMVLALAVRPWQIILRP